MRQHKPPPRKAGRPRAGVRAGERVRDYRALTVRLPEETHALLAALAHVRERPGWRVLCLALEAYAKRLPPTQKRQAQRAQRRFLTSKG